MRTIDINNLPRKRMNLDQIITPSSQARQEDTEAGIDELAENIKAVGLLQPIIVCKTEDNKYGVEVGQRRLNAFAKLKLDHEQSDENNQDNEWETIPVLIAPEDLTEEERLQLSAAENLLRRNLTATDLTATIKKLYLYYDGNISKMCRETGFSKTIINQHIGSYSLIDVFQDEWLLNKKTLPLLKRAQDLAKPDDNSDWTQELKDKAVKNYEIFKNSATTSDQNKEIDKLIKDGETDIDEIIKQAKKPKEREIIRINLLRNEYERLDEYSNLEGQSPAESAHELIMQSLDILMPIQEEFEE